MDPFWNPWISAVGSQKEDIVWEERRLLGKIADLFYYH